MKQQLLVVIAALALTVVLMPAASAQMPNMDMSWAIRSQMQLQSQGNLYARMVAMQYYNYMLRLRQMGYTRPSLSPPASPRSPWLPPMRASSSPTTRTTTPPSTTRT
ncbi:MAG: hypothetical protein LAO22_00170 [Acidobacteriia bacterium]|nr:hypothetical protein [Terriglobia bacterium]